MRRTRDSERRRAAGESWERQGLADDVRRQRSPRAGDRAPPSGLDDASGAVVTLSGALQRGPVVLAFVGSRHTFEADRALGRWAARIAEAGASLLVLSPTFPTDGAVLPGAAVLHDAGSRVAAAYGLFGDGPASITPMPATFVISQNAQIAMSLTEASFGDEFVAVNILSALAALRRSTPATP